MMKKNLLLALTSISSCAFAQLPVGTAPQNKKALIEEFTGIHCGYCPDGHRIGTQIYSADPTNVVLVNIHSGSFANASTGEPDFKTAEGTAIDVMPGMGITGYPAGAVNRKVLVGSVMAAGRSSWTSMANTIKSQSAYCNVALQGTLDPQTRVLTVNVEVYYTANSPVATNSINVFLLEDYIHGIQSNYGNPLYNAGNYNSDGTYNHNHVLRKALTPTFGLTIPNTTATNLFTTTLSYTIPATYGAAGKTTAPNFENLKLVGFVTQSDRDVINAADGPITLSNDAKAISVNLPGFICIGSNAAPAVTVLNNGLTTITNLTVTPSVDGVNQAATAWSGNLLAGASTNITLNNITVATGGSHTFSYTISGDSFAGNNTGKSTFYSATATGYQATPVQEGFVSAGFPPASWAIVNANYGPNWSRSLAGGGYNFSQESTKYDFFSNKVAGDVDELYLPPIDLSGANAPTMQFDVAHALRTANSSDKLEVMVTTNCGANWTTVFTQAGSVLATATQTYANAYTPDPNDPSHWKTEMVTLTGYNVPNVIAKFVVTSCGAGNNLYIDNVNLVQSAPTGINTANAINVSANIFPNPTNGIANIQITTQNSGNAKITVVNTLGQVVYTKNITLEGGANNIEIDTKEFASGVYNVVIDSDKGSITKKLTVAK